MNKGSPKETGKHDAEREHGKGAGDDEAAPPVPAEQSGLEENIEEIRRVARDNAAKDEAESKRQKSLEKAATWQARAAVMIAILTIVQIAVSAFQWSSMRDQSKAMIAQSDLIGFGQRAWVSFQAGGCAAPIAGTPYNLCLDLINYGPTPGHVTRLRTAAFIALSFKDFDEHFVQYESTGKEHDIGTHIPPTAIVPIDLQDGTDFANSVGAIETGERILVVIAHVKYEPDGETRLCYFYDPKILKFKLYPKHGIME